MSAEVPKPEQGWRTLHQVLPESVYEELLIEIKRVGRLNGIAPEVFDLDLKYQQAIGPRVMAWECLKILLERSDDEALRV